MRYIRFLAAPLVIVGLGFFAPGYSHADGNGADTTTMHVHQYTDSFVGTDLCGTGNFLINETVNSVAHVTVRPGGYYDPTSDSGYDYSETDTTTGSFTAVASNGVTYTGHEKFWGGGSVNAGGAASFTFTGLIVATGSDGSTINEHETAHFNQPPSQDYPHFFDKITGCTA